MNAWLGMKSKNKIKKKKQDKVKNAPESLVK